MKALILAGMVISSGLIAWCCGPKPKPIVDGQCPGEVCQEDAIGKYDCVCPEE